MENKNMILGTVEDLVTNFLYYDRQEDEELLLGAIEAAVREGTVTPEEMALVFKTALLEGIEASNF